MIDSKPRDLSAEDQETLRDFTKLVEDELLLLSQTTVDDLTKVSNRLGFNTIARHMVSLCRRTKIDAEMLFFDLDGFKAVNDIFGHVAGDQLLKLFAKLLTKCFRATDVIARLGGDEFVVLMTGTATADAALQRLQDLSRTESATLEGELRWSVGRVTFDPERHQTMESMLADADTRMYEDKTQRRLEAC